VAGSRSRSGPATGLIVVAIAIVAVAISVILVVRGSPSLASATPTPVGSLIGSLGLPAVGTPVPTDSAAAASAASGSPAAVASGSAMTVVDPTLLAALPATVDSVALTEDPDTERQDATDPNNAADLAGLAVAIAVDTASGDLAVASVVRVRPGVFSDSYFRDWRSTFDTAACSQANGVSATGTAVLAGRDAFTATCAGGLVTYHVHLPDRDLIVSVSSLGQRQFGRLILEGIR
jgi:hypothetical protein